MITEKIKKKLLDGKDVLPNILGQDRVKKELKSALLTNRHTIIVGPPGIGKTTLAKNVSEILPKNNFVRIQGSPDLTVEDILGDIDPIKAMKFGPLSVEAFTKGKIFRADRGVLFFDELNRCPEKLQNALLQILEEGNATIGSYDVDFPLDFIFIGTMNPEDSSTEKLSDVLLDRFDLIYMDYPESSEIEGKIISEKGKQIKEVKFPEMLISMIVYFVRLLREDKNLEKKPSVRASLGLYERAQANALLHGRKSVCYEDIREAVISVLAHRIRLKPSVKYLERPENYIKEKFEKEVDPEKFDLSEKGECP